MNHVQFNCVAFAPHRDKVKQWTDQALVQFFRQVVEERIEKGEDLLD